MSNDLQADLTADLLSDLDWSEPPRLLPRPSTTPTLSVSLTPLQWSRPARRSPTVGAGVTLLVGPWRVEVVF